LAEAYALVRRKELRGENIVGNYDASILRKVNNIELLSFEELKLIVDEYYNAYIASKKKLGSGKLWMAVLFIRMTAVSFGELIRIDDKRDFNLEDNTAKIINDKGISRIIPVSPLLFRKYEQFINDHPEAFGSVFNIYPQNFYRKFSVIKKKLGITTNKAPSRIIRDTRIIELLSQGVDFLSLHEYLGYSNMISTLPYLVYYHKYIKKTPVKQILEN